ncbi:MAG: hypothetical protein ACYTGL_17255 [Planctomycetota bacterium]|jgi:hypothetical protein
MSIEQAEQLKREYTDKWVVVDPGVAELKRFVGLTGKVKTVNMNCRALVEFEGPANIGWFDIDPGSLTIVDGPVKKEKPAAAAEKKPADSKPKAAAGGASPLDLIRKGGAAKPGGAAKKPAGGGASPLDLIRKQGAAKPKADDESAPDTEAPAEASTPEPAEEKTASSNDAKLSPLDLIRKQGAAKR